MKTLDREAVYKAIAGKAIERGLLVEEQGDSLLVQYDDPAQQEADHLHRQALRSMVQRFREEGRINPNSKVHTLAVNEGFLVRVELSDDAGTEVPEEADSTDETEGAGPEVSNDEIVAFLRKLLAS